MAGCYNYGELAKLREKVKELQEENERLEKQIQEMQQERIEKPTETPILPKLGAPYEFDAGPTDQEIILEEATIESGKPISNPGLGDD